MAPPALSLMRTITLPMMPNTLPATAGPIIACVACQLHEHPARFGLASSEANRSPKPAPARPSPNGTSFLTNPEPVLHQHHTYLLQSPCFVEIQKPIQTALLRHPPK